MTQDFEGFRDCVRAVEYNDAAGHTACMIQHGYDPAIYSFDAALELSGTQFSSNAQQTEVEVAGFWQIAFAVVAIFIFTRWLAAHLRPAKGDGSAVSTNAHNAEPKIYSVLADNDYRSPWKWNR